MVDLQALGGCEPVVCAEGHHWRGFSDLVALLRRRWAGNQPCPATAPNLRLFSLTLNAPAATLGYLSPSPPTPNHVAVWQEASCRQPDHPCASSEGHSHPHMP